MKLWPVCLIFFGIAVEIVFSSTRRCEVTRSEEYGIIDSRFPGESSLRNCSWIITASPGRRINLYFTILNISNPNCSRDSDADYLTIGKTIPKEQHIIMFICNKTAPFALTPDDVSTLNITLHVSNNSSSQFRLVYKAVDNSSVLNEEFREPKGVIVSPNYPSEILSPITSTYAIIAPKEFVIDLTLTHFNIETNNSVCASYLGVYDGDHHRWHLRENSCGGDRPELTYRSTGDEMFLKFVTFHPLKRFQGFHAVYEMVSKESRADREIAD